LCRLGFIDNQAIWFRARGFISGVAFFHSLIKNQKSKIKNQKSIGCADLDLLTIKQFGFGPGDLSVGWLSSIL